LELKSFLTENIYVGIEINKYFKYLYNIEDIFGEEFRVFGPPLDTAITGIIHSMMILII
jgi:hypothetical protein